MSEQSKYAFLALILVQCAHSVEEFTHRLWEVLAPARVISGLVSSDPATGFIIVNAIVILFGLWCYFGRVLPDHPSAKGFVWLWITLETMNGIGHPAMAIAASGYTPGVATAPLLLALAVYLAVTMLRDKDRISARQYPH
jgi:hypothetical protein